MVKKDSTKPKVLAVDDEEVMGYLIKRLFHHLGYHVDWVQDCNNALRKLDEENYDIILSDFRLPHMDGDIFYHEIAKRHSSLTKKLIFITGDTLNTKTIRFFRSHKIPYLSKPFDINKLKNVVEQIKGNS